MRQGTGTGGEGRFVALAGRVTRVVGPRWRDRTDGFSVPNHDQAATIPYTFRLIRFTRTVVREHF